MFRYIDPVLEAENKWIIKSVNHKLLCAIWENFEQIKDIIDYTGEQRLVVQKYIQDIFLVYNRKWKIRMFGLHTSFNGIHQGYCFDQGYWRLTPRTYGKLSLLIYLDKAVSPNDINKDYTKLTERHLNREIYNWIINDNDEPIGSSILTFDELRLFLYDKGL